MTDEALDFDWFMREGNNSLNKGDFADAANTFLLASGQTDDSYEIAAAFQMRGVALRLNKEFEEAHVALGTATLYARGNEELRLRIERDKAIVYMDEGKLWQASQLADDSYTGLRDMGSVTEAAASLGFLGRVRLRVGNKTEAYRMISQADALLRSSNNSTYELNNLIWLLKLARPLMRLNLLPRTLWLIQQTGQTRRLVEVASLAVGGNWLHNKAERYANRRRQQNRS